MLDRHRTVRVCLYTFLFSFMVTCLQGAIAQSAQQNPPTETIKTTVRHVLVPVLVHDKQNKHVPGLTKNDFVVTENGKEQTILSMEEVLADSNPVARLKTKTAVSTDGFESTHPVSVYTNELSGVQTKKRMVIIVIDRISFSTGSFQDTHQQNYEAKMAIIKFLATKLKNDALVELLYMDGSKFQVIHDFTDDTQQLIDAMQKTLHSLEPRQNNSSPIMSTSEIQNFSQTSLLTNQSISQSDNVFDAITNSFIMQNMIGDRLRNFRLIAEQFAGIPGHKTMLWITGGVQLNWLNEGGFTDGPEQQQFATVLKMLNEADISIYPVDIRGLRVIGMRDATQGSYQRSEIQSIADSGRAELDTAMVQNGSLKTIAEETGGLAFYNTNDFVAAMDKAMNDTAAYYMLSYAVDKSSTKPGWRRINVKVKRAGVDVSHRSGYVYSDPHNIYYSAESLGKSTRQKDIDLGLLSPFDFTALTVRVAFAGMRDMGDGKREIGFRIILPPGNVTIDEDNGNHMNLDFVYSVQDNHGVVADKNDFTIDGKPTAANLGKLEKQGILFDKSLKVPPGDYIVHFVVRDNLSGRTGSVQAPLKVE